MARALRINVRLVALVLAVDLLAAFALFTQFEQLGTSEDWVTIALLGSFALFSGGLQVKLPGMRGAIAISDSFVLTALGSLGVFPAAIVAALGVVGTLWGKEATRHPTKVAFNIGNVIVSVTLAGLVFGWVGGEPGAGVQHLILPLLLATTAHLVSNVTLVTTVVCLTNPSRTYLETWVETCSWAALSGYVAFPVSVALLAAVNKIGGSALALSIPPTWMLFTFYRTNRIKQELHLERISQVEEVNDRLEEKVAERTAELQKALTDIESANNRLRSANDRLTEANQAKSEFLANVSHELRTPLNAVIGFSDLLVDGSCGALNETQREYMCDIHDSGEHLLGLINDILDLTKIEAGKMEVSFDRFDVTRAAQEAVSMLRPLAARKNVGLELSIRPEVELAELDPGMFRQILVNLLSNAVKFTPEGGSIEVRAHAEGQDLRLDVEDTGIGIPEQHLSKVFEEFYQVDGSYSRNYEGTGLGLALVRRMVLKLNGEIDVVSTVGEGTTFRISFPQCLFAAERPPRREVSQAPPPPGPAPTTRRSDGSMETILVVEDNPLNMKLARNALSRLGYQVLEATDGEAALELLERTTVDLILMDIQLPGMDGLTVTRKIKAQSRLAAIPIVALSAHAKESDGLKAREAGCAGYITKPIRLSQFPREVRSYLEASQGAA